MENEEFAPDSLLIITEEKSWNPDCISQYNKTIIGLKNAYYKRGNPATAKEDVIEFLQSIPNEPDFIHFIDCLLGKLTNRL